MRSIQQHFEALIIEERIKCACPFFFIITLERGLLDVGEKRLFLCIFLCVFCFRVCVFLSGHFFGSGRGNDRLEVVTKKSHYFFFESIIVMSNPVVFFDMEIGGQPAGRIEMTVRLLAHSFSFSREEHHYSKRSLLLLLR